MEKMLLHPDFKEFLRFLNSHGVEYLLVGGYKVRTVCRFIVLWDEKCFSDIKPD